MRVCIVTQSLLNNYGGILQNYALQTVLQKMGHESITIDHIHKTPLYVYLLSWLKTILLKGLGKKRPFARITPPPCRKVFFDDFVQRYIKKTETINCVSSISKKNYQIETFIVGSDQVWRPRYNFSLKDMFLDFCKKKKGLKRIAYAASFGVENWEYLPKQTKICSNLAQRFDAISVREESGVKLCKEHLGVAATWVLDPTLLLKKDDYLLICKDVPISTEKYLVVYVLDENEQITGTYKKAAVERGLVVKKIYADSKSTLSVPEWLAMFRDASFVVTDSFHGTVFSIIFGKEFKCLYNKSRGSARFDSLLKLYEYGKIDEMRKFSLNWLKNALENT